MFEERNTVECGGSPIPQIEVHREKTTDVYPSVDTYNLGSPETTAEPTLSRLEWKCVQKKVIFQCVQFHY